MPIPAFFMVEKVKPLKLESQAETDYTPTEVDTTEDYVSAKGIVLEDSDDHRIEKSGNEMAFVDPVSSTKKVSDLVTETKQSGTSKVAVTKVLNFTGGVLVTDAGSGQANVDILGSSAKSPFAVMGYQGVAGVGRYLECSFGISTNDCGFVLASNVIITAISLSVQLATTVTISIYKNVTTLLDSISLSGTRKGYTLVVTGTASAGDEISAKVVSGTCTKPLLIVYF